MIPLDCNCGAKIGPSFYFYWKKELPTEKETEKMINKSKRKGLPPDRICNCCTNQHYDYFSKRNFKRDKKAWHKSSSSWKAVMAGNRKAKERHAMEKGDYENIPLFRRENDYNWL